MYRVTILLILLISCLFSTAIWGQTATLGTLSNYVLFTSDGALGNTGTTVITGNIGTNNGAITGFDAPTSVSGETHNADAVTAQCVSGLNSLYNQLSNIPVTNSAHAPAFGGGETLGAGVYATSGAGSVAGNLILDANHNSDAQFIFKFGGAFTTGASSTVSIINGGKACNIFWVAEGAVALAASTTMKGTIIAHPGAVSMGAGCNLEGRMLTTAGALAVYNDNAEAPTCSCYSLGARLQ